MKKIFLQIIATALICLVLQYFLPWWTMAIGSFAAGMYVGNKGYQSFIAGFTGVALLWLATAMIIDNASQSVLTQKLNHILPLHALLLTALIGGLVGGFSALTGALARRR